MLARFKIDDRITIISSHGTDYDAYVVDAGVVNGDTTTLIVEYRPAQRHSLDRAGNWARAEVWFDQDDVAEIADDEPKLWLEDPAKDDGFTVRSIVRH